MLLLGFLNQLLLPDLMLLGDTALSSNEGVRVSYVFVILAISIALSIAVVAVATVLLILGGVANFKELFEVVGALGVPVFDAFLLIASLAYVIRGRLHELIGFRVSTGLVGAGVLWGLGLFAVNIVVSYALSRIIGVEFSSKIYEYLISYELIKYTIVATAVVLAPLAEELYFRGLLYTSLKPKIGIFWASIASAAVFAAAHAMPTAFITLLVIGAVLAYVFERYKSIVPAMVAHAINNVLGVAVLLAIK